MQTISVAIGKTGVEFFVQQIMSHGLLQAVGKMKPRDRDLTIPNFSNKSMYADGYYSNIRIQLRQGSFTSFQPSYQSVTQGDAGNFLLKMFARSFWAKYKWHETWHYRLCMRDGRGHTGCGDSDKESNFDYGPSISQLDINLTLAFQYDKGKNTYDVVVAGTHGEAGVTPNIPGASVIQNQDPGCFTTSVSNATADSVAAIDFTGAIQAVVPPLLNSISASGHLTPDIAYDFSVGDSGITYPEKRGIAIGVTGKVRYKNQEYPVRPPAPIPVPPPPTDDHHVQVYVGDHAMNALHWAYFQAGLLAVKVTPSDLADPDVLKVATYVQAIPALAPYKLFAMHAEVAPVEAPDVSFREVYSFSHDAMVSLHKQLPADVYDDLLGMDGNVYVSWDDVTADLRAASVPDKFDQTIRDTVKEMGMVANHDLRFTLTIQNKDREKPNVIFSVKRTDILEKLALGVSGKAQTMQYAFQRVRAEAKFISSTVKGFSGDSFGTMIWPIVGEPRYVAVLQSMGKAGVPLPVMAGFQFLFDQAHLSIQKGFVSILAKVAWKSAALAKSARSRG